MGGGGQVSEVLLVSAETVSVADNHRDKICKLQGPRHYCCRRQCWVGLHFIDLWQVHEKELKASMKERPAADVDHRSSYIDGPSACSRVVLAESGKKPETGPAHRFCPQKERMRALGFTAGATTKPKPSAWGAR